MRSLTTFSCGEPVPQTQPLPGQVPNSAAGHAWAVDRWTQLDRFLILGTEGGTFHVSEPVLTTENAHAVQECLREDGPRVVRRVVEISEAGRAPRHTPALFVLAMAASPRFASPATNTAALAALPRVARTATHLYQFAGLAQTMRGWGRALRVAVAQWYLDRPVNELAHQLLKYRQRHGWRHRDLLRLSHPRPVDAAQQTLFRWVTLDWHDASTDARLAQVNAFERARRTTDEAEIVRLVREHRLTHEMLPGVWLRSPQVWEALLESMPYTALVRNLGRMSAVGLLVPGSAATARVAARLTDPGRIRRARVHPVALLAALLTYRDGAGQRGRLRWSPVGDIVDALDTAFYAAFRSLPASGKRLYLALDASGSMQFAPCAGMAFVSAAMASAALAMAVARTEPEHTICAFHEEVWPVAITKRDRLDRACDAIRREGRGTDASLPMRDALRRKLAVDAFVIVTDSETWAGPSHPATALRDYREATGIAAKLVVVAMAANRYSIADPHDALQMDVAGFDANVPALITEFVR